jgi:hypothetical protein
VQTFWVDLKRKSKYCPRFFSRHQAEAYIGFAFFFRFQEEAILYRFSILLRYQAEANTVRVFFYSMLSTRGKYWPRILLSFIL